MSSSLLRPAFSTLVVLISFLLTVTHGHPARRPPIFLPKIMDGGVARPGEFPYLVLLEARKESTGRYEPICSGAILNPTTILTAAHCFEFDATRWRIVAGEYDLTRDEGTEQIRILDTVVRHHGIDFSTYENDMAVAFISSDDPLDLDDPSKASPISLPSSSYDSDLVGRTGRVAGWGSMTDSDLTFSPILNKVDLPLQSDEVCESVWGGAFTPGQKLCAGRLEGGQDTCHGDSGAPLVVDGVVVGVVSFGEGCGQKDRLGVYVRVSHYVRWIQYVIRVMGR